MRSMRRSFLVSAAAVMALGLAASGAHAAPAGVDGNLDDVANDSIVERVSLDGRPFRAPQPLDVTMRMTAVDGVHRKAGYNGRLLTGAGVTLCDIDAGVDVMHPMFFRPDGG